MADQQFCLRWNNHQSTLISVFDTLLENGTLVDCTLAAEGQYLKAHKVVLCACSPYLETLLSQHYEKHPIVILKDVKFSELKSMMDYMYRGEVNISQDQLGTFLKAAESLQIKGLSDNGADGDARDVGSTSKVPQRKPSQSVTTTRSSDAAPESPAHRSRDGSISPTSRKRRRIRRNSQGDDSNVGDSHLDTSNSCDLPSQAQSIPIVPNIPATVTSSITTTPIIKTPIIKPEQTEIVNRIDPSNMNSLPPESGLLKEKIEPSEPLLEPKTEYLEDVNTEDSVEDLTLDDDDEMDGMDISNMSNMSNMSRPGPSHGNDLSSISNQGFAPWQLGGNQSGTDEVFMAAQEAVSAHRDSQGPCSKNDVANDEINDANIDEMERKAACEEPIPSKEINYDTEEVESSILKEADFPKIFQLTKNKQKPDKNIDVTLSTKIGDKIAEALNKGGVQVIELASVDSTSPIKRTSILRKAKEKSDNAGASNTSQSGEQCMIDGESELEGKQGKKLRKRKKVKINETAIAHEYEEEEEKEDDIKKYMAFDEELQKFKCLRCNNTYKSKTSLVSHARNVCGHAPKHQCPFCQYKARSAVMIRVHAGRVHNAWPRLGTNNKWIF